MKKIYMLFYLLLLQFTIIHAQGWKLVGNAGTIAGTNFLGTTDAQALMIKVNNQKSGYIDYANTNFANTSFGYQTLLNISGGKGGNSAFGYQSLFKNTTGAYNTATGQFSMLTNTTGSSNVASGVRSLYSNTTGSFNTAIGNRALYFNTTSNNNTAIGNRALFNNTTGYSNVAVGVDALNKNTVSSNLVAIGDSALFNNQLTTVEVDDYSGIDNTAVGSKSLFSNTAGAYNIAIGHMAMYSNRLGSQNVAIGYQALYKQSGVPSESSAWVTANVAIGFQSLYNNVPSSGFDGESIENTAVGSNTLYHNTEGADNSAFGYNALYNTNIGYENTAHGAKALFSNTSGSDNTALGEGAGYSISTGSFNTFIGYNANSGSFGTLTNATAIGNGASVASNNHVRIGNGSVTSIGGYVNWTNISDGRVKKNIKSNVPGLAFINKLNPVTYNLDLDAADKIVQAAVIKDKNGKSLQPSADEVNARTEKEQVVYTGFVAQDVEKAAKDLNYNFSGIDVAKNDHDLYGLRYSEFVVPLVKAVQELSKMNDDKDAKINDLQKQIDELKQMIVANSASTSSSSNISLSSASLEQNIPNPFTNATTINYVLPQKFITAQILIIDKNGKSLKQVNLSGTGKGSVNVDASMLSSGAYSYSLIIDGKIIATKQMVSAK